ncbi:unnamed protein product [Mytilus coruscus]|uniref:Uncharacterized protein n=1 Tax=Mytilus coruscus TaxID=42192 RepID=A0A6J8EM63_MYTCO|nr:unnamed protein product [Mytilus coruscus]
MTKPHMDESETEVKYNLDRFKNGTCVTIEDFHNTDDCISINSYENDLSCLLVNKHANTVPLTDFDGSYNKEDTLERNDSRMLGDSDEHKEKEELTLDYDKHDKGKPVVCSNETTSSKRNEVQNIKVKGQVTSVSTPLPKKNSKSICTEGMRNKEPEKPEPRENPKGLHKEQKQGWQTLYFLLLLLPALTTCLHAKTPEHRKCDRKYIQSHMKRVLKL